MLIADIFITTKNRPDLLRKSLESLRATTRRNQYRLTVVRDGDYAVTDNVLSEFKDIIDYVLTNQENAGLGPSINMALAHIDALKRWDGEKAPPFTTYSQDDCVYKQGWLELLSTKYLQLKGPLHLAFASGMESIEHPVKKNLGNGMILKDWLRGTNLLATHDVWMSMWPIPKIDPETGRERGKPDNGLGSGVDWHFIRAHPNSVCRTGRTNLVIPGLICHAGFDQSTWLKRELPESEEDKRFIHESLQN